MVDLDNGFNTGDRWVLLEEVKAHFPQLYPWAVTCYGQHSHLKFGDQRLSSQAGVQQGDPLGPLFFALLLQPVLLKVQDVDGLTLNAWYLDDSNLAGTTPALQESWDILVREGVPRGLFVSLDKSLATIREDEEGGPRESLLSRDPLDPGARVKVPGEGEGGVKVLGAPVGSCQFEAEVLQARVDGVGVVLEALPSMDDPHCELYLLRSCFSFPKFGHPPPRGAKGL